MMGLKSWLIKHFLSKDIPTDLIKKDIEKSKFDLALDEYLVTSQQRHREAIKTADKLQKGKLMQQQSKEIIQSMRDLDADAEEEKKPDLEDDITATIIKSLFSGAQAPPKSNPLDPFDDPNPLPALPDPAVAAVAPRADSSALRQAARQKIEKLSEEELTELKKAGFL